MLSNIFFGIGIIFVLVYGWGFLSRQEFKTHTNLRIVVFWIMALGFYLVHSVPGFHLIYTFPLGIGLAFLGIKSVVRGSDPFFVLIISGVIWSFFLMAVSSAFGTFV
tara:strand:- start:1411 stop:1731 length:321 start_codon:yes stop_codon:yes gene_type:complete